MKFLFPLAFLPSVLAYGQCDGLRYREFIFSEVQQTSDLVYGRNANYEGDSLDLLLDVFEPVNDQEALRPLVIFAHGGFFLFGEKEGSEVVPACEDLAKMGYVSASINYRLGFPFTDPLSGPMTEAVMRGVQDMKAAIRYFRRTAAEDGNPWRINPDEIYIAGVSAGGYICLHLAYLDDEAELPDYLNLENPGLSGGLEGDSGNEGYSSEVNAIISIAGALGDSTWVKESDEPACLFHGDNDNTVPYGSDFQMILGVVPVIEVDGSASVSSRMDNLGLTHCFETYEGQDHVPSVNQEAYYDTTLSIITNFLSHFICESEFDCAYREIAVNLDEQPISTLAIYPVPSSGIIYVNGIGPCELRILDYSGRVILTSAETDSIDISNLTQGVYMLEIITGHQRLFRRIVRE
jgi:para-nitrobenzyl esterase